MKSALDAEPCKLSLFHAAEQRKQGQSQPAVGRTGAIALRALPDREDKRA